MIERFTFCVAVSSPRSCARNPRAGATSSGTLAELVAERVQCGVAVAGGGAPAVLTQMVLQELHDAGVVIDDEDLCLVVVAAIPLGGGAGRVGLEPEFADHVLEPAMQAGGTLVSLFGGLVGTGSGAGMAVMFLATGVLGILTGLGGLAFPTLRRVERDLPNAETSSSDRALL